MKLYVQWSTDPPTDWIQIDSSEWASLPKKPVPVGGEVIDSTPGWVAGINCQGVHFSGDHYAVIDTAQGTVIASWVDDLDDRPAGDFHASVILFTPPFADPAIGGRMNVLQQDQGFYGANLLPERLATTYATLQVDSFDNLVIPGQQGQAKRYSQMNQQQIDNLYSGNNLIRHGINMPDALWDQHKAARTTHGWREWIE